MTRPPATILVVDDEPENRKLLVLMLSAEGYLTRTAASGQDALTVIALDKPDMVLLDVMMPGLDGYAVASILKSDPRTCGIPIIMVSALADRDARLTGLQCGVEDFVSKPVDRAELGLRVRNLLRLKELSDALKDQGMALEQEVQARTADLEQLAHFDALTGLPNRTVFHEELTRTLRTASADDDVAVLFVYLDRFKSINDTWGHGVGDDLLGQFAARLSRCVRRDDLVGRIGGDEFAVLVVAEGGRSGPSAVARTVLDCMTEPFELGGQAVAVSASIGIGVDRASCRPERGVSSADDLLRYADTAMYHAKLAGRSTFRVFTDQMGVDVEQKRELEEELRLAVREQQFVLHYQPKVRLVGGQVCGSEALIRWERPGLGLVAPDAFIPSLESTGLIVPVGRWVIDEACRQLKAWSKGPLGALPVSVNVSGRQFAEGTVLEDVAASLHHHGVPPHLLELELTESMLMVDTTHTVATLQALKRLGVRISVDDFGTGYSSLAYLRRFPIDTLKIDREFVRDVTHDGDDAAIVQTIIQMAHSLKLGVVAEGVETVGQLAFLQRQHCDQVQGYYVSRPLPVVAFDALRASGTGLVEPTEKAQGETVLLFGAEPIGLLPIRGPLTEDGYVVLDASTIAEALELLARHQVQVIVCDQPTDLNGGESLLDAVQELHPHTLRFVVAGSSNVSSLTRAINRSGIHRYYTDPWDLAVLRADVRDAFRLYWLELGTRSPTVPPAREDPGGRLPLHIVKGA